jgi:hypothetical protein
VSCVTTVLTNSDPPDPTRRDNLACLHTVMPWDYDKAHSDQRRVMWRQTMGIDDTTHTAGQVDRIGTPPFASE